jgi:hypothetical protein
VFVSAFLGIDEALQMIFIGHSGLPPGASHDAIAPPLAVR